MGKRTFDADVDRERTMTMTEVGLTDAIDTVESPMTGGAIEAESFMNDLLTIMVAKGHTSSDLTVICPSVNGVNQPIVRGIKQTIKRKYVEALARCRTVSYDCQQKNPLIPDSYEMTEREGLTYPFQVYKDPHPYGYAWLDSILETPA